MKIIEHFPNYSGGLRYFIGDKNPVLASNNSKVYSYYVPLANFKKGFDFYELKQHHSGAVYFRVATMLGLKTILQTDSQLVRTDMSVEDWARLVSEISISHFRREEYQALRSGYVKKESGCFGSFLLSGLIISVLTYVQFIK